jgi:hypothetical protein
MDKPKKQLVAEALIDLHRRLSTLATRSHEPRTHRHPSSAKRLTMAAPMPREPRT